ncbi:MAG: VanZ family protein [Deltaproteobacteria bacterium]|uniref:VanZ family protein n=1 Tax=Candidatus Zymogenus saltonus TaxID=2844893 RepID=A0A9D8KFV7_9DELT|nr:VanZ family protein [Candidatus Zymogenus saltonus]
MKFAEILSEKKTAWSIVLLYIILIFSTLGDVVVIVEFAESKLGNIFNIVMNVSPYIFFLGLSLYTIIIRKERRPARYVYLILILIAFFFLRKYLSYPIEKVHLIEYSIFGALFFWAVSVSGLSLLSSFMVAVVASLVVGSADELVQAFIPSRYFSIKDLLINFQSGILGAAIYAGFVREDEEDEEEGGGGRSR